MKENGVIVRKWRLPDIPANDEWKVVYQIIVPLKFQNDIFKIAHDNGHLGVTKTLNKIHEHFHWPKMKKEIENIAKPVIHVK